jgi:MIP family channel proteins
MEYDSLRKAVVEFVGTFTLVFAGVGAVAVGSQVGVLGVAFAFGLALVVMISALGHISGGHFNPAVTLGALICRKVAPPLAAVYWISQFAGATAAALLLEALYPSQANLDAGAPTISEASNLGVFQGMLLEAVLTFFLVFVVIGVAIDSRGSWAAVAGIPIGLTVTMGILVAGPLTGGALNPARAFGPQLVFNVWSDGWIYYVGPLLGGLVAGVLYAGLYLGGSRATKTA